MIPLTALIALGAAWFSDLSEAEPIPNQAELQLSDAALWDLIISGESPLSGMTFFTAVNQDPRRVEALIMQRVQLPLAGALAPILPPETVDFRRHAYVQRNAGLRQTHGQLTATVLADNMAAELIEYAPILEKAVWPMASRGDRAAQAIQATLVAHSRALRRGITEAKAIAIQAGQLTENRTEAQAWTRLADTLQASWAPISDRLEHLDVPVPELTEGIDLEEIIGERVPEEDMAILPVDPDVYGGLFVSWVNA